MDLGLKGKSVLVLASSKGLGKAIAQEFVREGARVMITSRDALALQTVAREMREVSGEVQAQPCDITKLTDIKELVEKTVSAFGTIDILVNNCGGPRAGNFDDLDDQAWQEAFELTLLSYIRSIREVLPYMRKNGGGKIVNIASISIKQPLDRLLLSNTLRAGVNGLAKSLSQELAKDNILINTVGPGKFATDRVIEIDQQQAERKKMTIEDLQNAAQAAIPLGRYGDPQEFAKTVVFLASDANTYITGQALIVDGGLTKAL